MYNRSVELQVGSVVGQMLAAGSVLGALKLVIDACGDGLQWNLLHAIDHAKEAASAEQGEARTQYISSAIDLVEQFLIVFLCAIYVDENDGYNEVQSFSKWASELEEVQNVLARLRERPAATLKYVEATNLMASTVKDRTVSRRKGDVLTANYAMKADHFPGCAKKGIRPAICGAPNFRKVELINVFGVAIPTIKGVHNVLSVLGATSAGLFAYPGESNDEDMQIAYPCLGVFDPSEGPSRPQRRGRVIWVNLREEPLMYVGDKPYVFRDMAQPYVNVELTGIEGSKVEMLEVRLKADILKESKEYDGNFLVHDEGKPGELVGTWEPATNETVRTVREVYDDAERLHNCRVAFFRMPVTDEQSPELKDFDMLVRLLLPEIIDGQRHADISLSFVFNCQMGRGRTTTGMVVCCLLIGCMMPEYFETLQRRQPNLFKPTDSELSQGNYKCIQQIKAIMPSGRRSKLRLDLVLEACAKMQNLRSAIEVFVLVLQSPDAREEERARAHHHGLHYLQRYFNLIAFTEYLSTELDPARGTVATSFENWMNARPELVSIREAAELE
jgi:protein-tyrosine phosphatase